MRTAEILRLIEALENESGQHGYEIVDAQILGSASSPILRIYIDKEDGITIDDIAEAQQEWLEAIVDEIDIIEGEYILEVSSPGIDRPLRTKQHFIDFEGEDAKITCDPINGRKRFTGRLGGMKGDNVVICIDDDVFEIPFESIVSANIKGRIDF